MVRSARRQTVSLKLAGSVVSFKSLCFGEENQRLQLPGKTSTSSAPHIQISSSGTSWLSRGREMSCGAKPMRAVGATVT